MTTKVGGATAVAVAKRVEGATAEEESAGESREEDLFHSERRGFVERREIPATSLMCQGGIPPAASAASRFDTLFVLA